MNKLKKVYTKNDFTIGETVKITLSKYRGAKEQIKHISDYGLSFDETPDFWIPFEFIKKVSRNN